MTPADAQTQLAHLKNLLASRTNADGSAKPGYRRNVDMLREEIRRCQRVLAADRSDNGDAVAV